MSLDRGLADRVRKRLAADGAVATPARVASVLRDEAGIVGDVVLLELLREAQSEFVGAGPLEPLLADPATTDVLVNGPGEVWIDRGRGLERTELRFADDGAVRRLAQRLAASAGRRLDDAQPWVDASLADGTRLHAVLPPVAQDGTCLSLRVLRRRMLDIAQLQAGGSLDDQSAALVRLLLRARLAFLVTGGTGSGKTTLLAALLGEIDAGERIVLVEDAGELAPRHPHVVRLVARSCNVEGAGQVSLRDLVRQALRMRPDRIVVGEVRGAEVVDLLAALNTGHEGCCGTVHANSPAELPARLEALGALGGLDRAALHSQFAAAVHVVLHLARQPDPATAMARRVLAEIAVIDRIEGWVQVVAAWRVGEPGPQPGTDRLAALLKSRRVDAAELAAAGLVGAGLVASASVASASVASGSVASEAARDGRAASARGTPVPGAVGLVRTGVPDARRPPPPGTSTSARHRRPS